MLSAAAAQALPETAAARAAAEVVGEQPLPEGVLVPVPLLLLWAAAVGAAAMPRLNEGAHFLFKQPAAVAALGAATRVVRMVELAERAVEQMD